mmetsp:Transcript_35250/g.59840  ORF Transcript_35250/g.59840 Transcript_35250/m.59840 type:complete len:228 (-) Transcript_35250:525-1208(-)
MLNSFRWLFLSQCDIIHVDSTFFQHISQLNASPFGAGHGTNHPMRCNINLVILIMQILPPIPRTLQCRHHLMLLKLGLKIVQRELSFPLLLALGCLDALPGNDQPVLLRVDVRHGQMATCVKQMIRRDVIVRQQLDARFTIERLARGRQQLLGSDRIALEHVSDLTRLLAREFGILGTEAADAVCFDPFEDVGAKVLSVDVPVGFEILTGRHHQSGKSSRMALLEGC